MGKPNHYLCFFAILFTGLVAIIMFHDDNIPNSITESEKAYVLSTWEDAESGMDQIIERFRRFIDEPEQETLICDELAEAVDQWYATMEVVRNEPVFFVPFPEYIEAAQRLNSTIERELAPLTSEFCEEVSRRRDAGIHSQDHYDRLRVALSQDLEVRNSAPCVRSECRWCRSKYTMTRYLLSKF